jgi:hypothetical protein
MSVTIQQLHGGMIGVRVLVEDVATVPRVTCTAHTIVCHHIHLPTSLATMGVFVESLLLLKRKMRAKILQTHFCIKTIVHCRSTPRLKLCQPGAPAAPVSVNHQFIRRNK